MCGRKKCLITIAFLILRCFRCQAINSNLLSRYCLSGKLSFKEEDKRVNIFPRGINSKVKRLVFEPVYYDVWIEYDIHWATGTPSSDGFMPFPKAVAQSEKKTTPSRIWTSLPDSISYVVNNVSRPYGNLLSFLLRCGTRTYERGTQWDSNSLV